MTRFRLPAALFLCLASGCDAQSRDPRQVQVAGEVAELRVASRAVARGLASPDSLVRGAALAVEQGSPWKASRALAPRLRATAGQPASLVILGARAAAEWGGWTEVDRLLADAPWLDTALAGEGRELLARSALAASGPAAATRARENAAAALGAARDPASRAAREVLLARALDRADARPDARAAYTRAAGALPLVADWLRLRAAGAEASGGAREELYAAVKSPAARARVRWTEAQARERSGELLDAARLYDSLGAVAPALRLRLAAAAEPDARAQARQRALAALERLGGSPTVRDVVALLDSSGSLTPAEELVVARAAREAGLNPRAATGFARAAASAPLSADDRYAQGLALYGAGRGREAAAVLAGISTGPLAPRATYQRARALLRAGDGTGARRVLAQVVSGFPNSSAAADAQYLLADLATDDGRDTDARRLFAELARRWPSSSRAPEGLFQSGILAAAHGAWSDAATDFEAVAARWPSAGDANAARYWAGRARAQAGDQAKAAAHWKEIVAREPLSYYAMLAGRRLRTEAWKPAAAVGDSLALPADVATAMERVRVLDLLGMDAEVRFELDALTASAERDSTRLLAVGTALRDAGYPSRATALAFRAIAEGVRDARAYRLAYPIVDRADLERASRRERLDPALVAALIRQESSFNPRAQSRVGARGLMQLMPSVGRDIARFKGYPIWDPALLFVPEVSLELGTSHLAAALREYPSLVRALAAYNAGSSRVVRWAKKPGAADAELFAERIPFDETRDYVRIVQRNIEIYKQLYGW